MSIHQDYLSPYPIFGDYQFKCMFWVSKSVCETICVAVRLHPFVLNTGRDCCDREAIDLDVKVLMSLKMNAYGVAANAFVTISRWGNQQLANVVSVSMKPFFSARSLRVFIFGSWWPQMPKTFWTCTFGSTAFMACLVVLTACTLSGKTVQLCFRVPFKQGKEGVPTFVLEEMADYNLWIWHAVFKFAVTRNESKRQYKTTSLHWRNDPKEGVLGCTNTTMTDEKWTMK